VLLDKRWWLWIDVYYTFSLYIKDTNISWLNHVMPTALFLRKCAIKNPTVSLSKLLSTNGGPNLCTQCLCSSVRPDPLSPGAPNTGTAGINSIFEKCSKAQRTSPSFSPRVTVQVLYMRVPPGLSRDTACWNNKNSFRKDNPGTQWFKQSTHHKSKKLWTAAQTWRWKYVKNKELW